MKRGTRHQQNYFEEEAKLADPHVCQMMGVILESDIIFYFAYSVPIPCLGIPNLKNILVRYNVYVC